ncbi:hypothetical protein JCM8547_005644 [Rhodosporidiobolus lusitaniae]
MSRPWSTCVSNALRSSSATSSAQASHGAASGASRNFCRNSLNSARVSSRGQARTVATSAARAASGVTSRPSIPTEVIRNAPSSSTISDPDGADTESPLDTSAPADIEPSTPRDAFIPPPLTSSQLSLLYTYTTPPPESALSAFASRLALATPDVATLQTTLLENLPLVEQACIHESFWDGVRSLQDSLSLSSSSSRHFTLFHDAPLSDSPSTSPAHAHNGALAAVGNALLGTLTAELILQSFPNLPTTASKAALTYYAGPKHLAQVASASWGVGPSRLERALVGRDADVKVSRKEKAYGHLVEGRGGARKLGDEVGAREGAAGSGLVRWNRKPTSPTRDAVLFEDALASLARAVVGLVYQTSGLSAARSFVHAHFLPRLLPPSSTTLPSPTASSDLTPLLKFSQPNRILSLSLASYGLPALRHSLLKESGRLSAHPTFISGAFSGQTKLGEGFGSSLKMSQFRASEDALRRMYLGGGRREGLPSDEVFEGWSQPAGYTEVEHESR